VTPRRGRLVVFSSGEENVHAVGKVTRGGRSTLSLWLSGDARVAAAEE
jgi:predicted 2-oxoglutarate/Fe(II)-dependent dioxygenase YbiX